MFNVYLFVYALNFIYSSHFFLLYSHLGCQLENLDKCPTKWQRIRRLIINIIFNVSVFICLKFFNPYWNESENVENNKKLLSKFLINVFKQYLISMFISNTIFIYCRHHQIVKLMNFNQFNQIYNEQNNKNSTLMIRKISFTLIISILFEFANIYHDFYYQQICISILQFITCIILTINSLIFLFIVHYIKQSTIYCLEKIYKQNHNRYLNIMITMNMIDNIRRSSIKQIQQLANHNRYTNQILSFPLIIYLSSLICETLIIFDDCLENSGNNNSLSYVLYSITCWSYTVYIIHLDIKINRLIQQIFNTMIKHESLCSKNCNQTLMATFTTTKRQSSSSMASIEYLKNQIQTINFHRQIKFFLRKIHIIESNELYEMDFRLQLYQLKIVDLKLFLNIFLFVLAYSVLIYQTFNY